MQIAPHGIKFKKTQFRKGCSNRAAFYFLPRDAKTKSPELLGRSITQQKSKKQLFQHA
jgi:hypothetical protein